MDQEQYPQTKIGIMQSFWVKVFAIMAVAVFMITTLTWIILTPVQRRTAEESMEKELRKKGLLIAKLVRGYGISTYYEKKEFANLQNTLVSIQLNLDPKTIYYIFVKDAEGKVIAQAPEDVTRSETSLGGRLDTVNPIREGRGDLTQFFSSALNTDNSYTIMDIAMSVGNDEKAELHIGIQADLDSLHPPLWWNLLILGAMLALWGVGALFYRGFIRGQINQPVAHLVQYVAQIGQGNMDYTADIAVDNELNMLKNSLDEMVTQLKGTVQTESDINRMQGQIMNMLSTVSAAADGNLTVEAEVTADALGSLADAFNMMVASLASLVEQVRKSASDMNSATNDILLSSAQMIKGAEEQQNHINNITSAVDEIAVSMQQVANNAEAAARASQMATEAAQKGEKSVEETILGMHRIRNTVQVTSKKIKSLGDRSIEIGEITTTIEDIARNTTILALNAAIEAARAGEHGRGFGVVAEEVRKLAERAGKATQDIGDLIKGIQAETNEAVRTMEEGTREVEEGTRLADVAGKSLKEIDKSVGQVADLIQEISLAAKQQARGTDGVVRSMETISDIANLHADGVRKSTEIIERLATLSDRLVEAIGNFKIRESETQQPATPERKPVAAKAQPPQPRPQPQPPQPQPQLIPFVGPAGEMAGFTPQSSDDEDELITEEDFFKTS